MKVASIVLISLGVVFLVIAVVLVLIARRKQASWQRMLGSAGRSVADLLQLAGVVRADMGALPQVGHGGRGSYAEYVTVTGTAEPGPGGPMTSPLTGTDCVWHRVQVERRTRRTRRTGENTNTTETHTETVSDVRSQVAFGLNDGTGTVRVEPEKAHEESLELVREDIRSSPVNTLGSFSLSLGDVNLSTGTGDDVTEITREWVIRTGSRLTAAGTLTDRRGQLALMTVPEVPLVLTRLDHDELVASEQKKQKQLMIGATVLAVLGVAGVVIGVVLAL